MTKEEKPQEWAQTIYIEIEEEDPKKDSILKRIMKGLKKLWKK